MLNRRTFALAAMAAGAALPAIGRAQPATNGLAVDEGMFVDINGMPQWITIRGRDLKNPVLLLLHGGPGLPSSYFAPAYAAWEQDFTLVQWDQPGGGATYLKAQALGRDQGPLTVARYVADGLAVAEFICAHLKTNKLVLLGNSWGTMLGVMMSQRRPDLVAAYVGTSQAVSGPEGGKLGYELALKAARERGDTKAVSELERVGPPPYKTFQDFLVRQTYCNPPGLPPTPEEAAASAAQAKLLSVSPPPDAHYVAKGLPPYDFWKVFIETQVATWQETAAWEARASGLTFHVPVFVIQGDHDLNTPISLARAWVDDIQAPAKGFETIRGAGHNTLAFSDQVLALLDKHVRPLAVRQA
jgi:pimeloyl-ACP methyl ester carboxylesterase